MVVKTLEENGVHVLSPVGDADSYADDGMEVYTEELFPKTDDLKKDIIKDCEPCPSSCEKQFPANRKRRYNYRLIEH